MEKREVPTSEYEPEDVPQRRSEAFACLRDDGAAERPDAEQGDSQRSNAERDRHDEDEAEHSGECVSDEQPEAGEHEPDRKSTRLNSSHLGISYAVFCLKK